MAYPFALAYDDAFGIATRAFGHPRGDKNARNGWPSGVERFQGIRNTEPGGPPARNCAFSHPDSTVGSGISPDRATGATSRSRAFTAGRDLAVIARGLTQTPKAYFS